MRSILLFICFVIFSFNASSQAFYTIIDDDVTSNKSIQKIKELSDKKGIKITFAPIVRNLVSNKNICDSLLSYQEQGFHICNHSYSHSPSVWREMNLQMIEDELKLSHDILDSLGFVDHDYFVYPYGKFQDGIRDSIIFFVSNYFKLAFDSRGRYNRFDAGQFNKYYIHRFAFRSHNDWLAVKLIIDEAIEKDGWIVFLTHSGRSDFDVIKLERIINYCQSKGLRAFTVHEAYQKIVQFKESFDESQDFNLWDEILDVLYMHRFSLIFIGGLLIVLIIVIKKLYF